MAVSKRSWQDFQIQESEIWEIGENGKVWCADLILTPEQELRKYFKPCDLYYVDPPWNQGLFKWFYTHGGIERPDNSHINVLLKIIFEQVSRGEVAYIEIGYEFVEAVEAALWGVGAKNVVSFHTKYAKDTLGGRLVRADFKGDHPATDFTGADSADLPSAVLKAESWAKCIGDMCTGKGCTGRAALQAGVRFRGTELSKYRLATLIAWAAKRGYLIQNEGL